MRIPSTLDGMVEKLPEVAEDEIVVRADQPLHVFPSEDVVNWLMYDFMALVPATVPLHESVTGVSKYEDGAAVNVEGGVGKVLRRALFEIAQSE